MTQDGQPPRPAVDAAAGIQWRRGLSRLFWAVWLIGWGIALANAFVDVFNGDEYAQRNMRDGIPFFIGLSIAALGFGRVLDWVLAGFGRR